MSGADGLVKIPELRKRILFTLLMLMVYRIGVHIPTPGVDSDKLQELFAQMNGTLFEFSVFRWEVKSFQRSKRSSERGFLSFCAYKNSVEMNHMGSTRYSRTPSNMVANQIMNHRVPTIKQKKRRSFPLTVKVSSASTK